MWEAFGYSWLMNIFKEISKVRITEHVKGHALTKATIIIKQHNDLIIEMEMQLIILLDDQNQHNFPISFTLLKKRLETYSVIEKLYGQQWKATAIEIFF